MAGKSEPIGAATTSSNASPTPTASTVELSTKSKDELIRLANRINAELNIKNKVIYDLKMKEQWLLAEFMAIKKNAQAQPATDDDPTSVIEHLLSSKDSLSAAGFEDARVKLFQALLYFRRELAKAKNVVDQNSSLLRDTEMKLGSTQAEVGYLQSVLQRYAAKGAGTPDIVTLERERIQQLEQSLRAAQNDISTLQSKVALWCRASKKNQDARIQAEASQRTIESEAATLRGLLAQSKATEEQLRRRITQLEDELIASQAASTSRSAHPAGNGGGAAPSVLLALENKVRAQDQTIKEQEQKIRSTEDTVDSARQRITEFERTMQDACQTVDDLEKENTDLRAEVRARDATIAELSSRLHRLESAVSDSGRDVEEVATRLLAAEDDAARAVSEVERLRSETRELSLMRDRLLIRVDEAEGEVESVRRTLRDAQTSGDRHAEELADRLRRAEERHLSEIQSVREQLTAAVEARAQVEKDLEEAIELCSVLQEELTAARNGLTGGAAGPGSSAGTASDAGSVAGDASSAGKEIDSLRRALAKFQEREEEAVEALETAEARVNALEELSRAYPAHIEELTAQLAETNDDVRILSEKLARATTEAAAMTEASVKTRGELAAALAENERLRAELSQRGTSE
ncbi:hypothetical protein DFJ73DRAFT_763616 [Zopfochytrium polystomum]|nr:hypothetical protein DFJ73DRAFT_763616 [Zopfochytrium polystomum]